MRLLNILKENNIIKIAPTDNLSQALSKLSSSHDAGFVFDEDGKYYGVINPYYTVIKSSYPGSTKVSHCLIHPPRLYINLPLTKVAQLLVQSKIHYLPVFDPTQLGMFGKKKDRFLGIISARRVIKHISKLPIFSIKIGDFIKFKKLPVTIHESSTVSAALNLFKTHRFSKLIVVDGDGRLKGVLSYYDLISFMTQPKSKEKRGDRKGNKSKQINQPIKYFFKTTVLTLDEKRTLREAINLIIGKKIGSVIVVDQDKRPLNIITTQDLLNFYVREEKQGLFKQLSSNIDKLLSKKKT